MRRTQIPSSAQFLTTERDFSISMSAFNSIILQSQERRPTPDQIPAQQLDYPAKQSEMTPAPDTDLSNYRPANMSSHRSHKNRYYPC